MWETFDSQLWIHASSLYSHKWTGPISESCKCPDLNLNSMFAWNGIDSLVIYYRFWFDEIVHPTFISYICNSLSKRMRANNRLDRRKAHKKYSGRLR